jgi:UDP-GlcNAc:undecaprenyl-phosphate GlcNAc-1-phosphate transferase
MTLKFTERKEGFRVTPMDFIVVVLALVVMALPRDILPEEAVKKVLPVLLAMFFGYEVLVGELRGQMNVLVGVTILSLLIVTVRGVV